MAKRRKAKNDLIDLIMGFTVLITIFTFFKTNSIPLTIISFTLPLLLITLVTMLINNKKKSKLKKSGIREIDKMDGFQFEEYLALLFRKHDYKAKVTKSRGDYGADLILSKDGDKIVVQAKRYSSKVGIKAIQEIVSSMSYYNANKSMVITNNYFTTPAITLAKTNNVELIDRDKLIKMLINMNPNGNQVDPVKVKQNHPPICPKCKTEMILRSSKNGKEFFGCSNYPSCNQTKSM